jgi:excisionase family DNA binding protein
MNLINAGKFLKLREVAQFTGIPVGTLRAACHRGELAFLRTTTGASAPMLVRVKDVEEWIERCKSNTRVLSPAQTKKARARAGGAD